MPFVPFVQLLGHRARGRERKHVWHVQPIPQRQCALGGGLGPWDFNQHDFWVKMPLEAFPPTRETSDLMWSASSALETEVQGRWGGFLPALSKTVTQRLSTGLDVSNFLATRTLVSHPGLPYIGCIVRVVMLWGPLVIYPRSQK